MHEIKTPRFSFASTPLAGLWQVQRRPIRDARGFFARFYCAQEFATIGLAQPLAQINHSLSSLPGTLRGLHFQHPPHAETKVVSCVSGRIFDVAVDLRSDSPTFLQWFGVELSAQAQNSLVIPPGFAHGFQTLEADSEILYLVSVAYSAEYEDGLNPLDPALAIPWPLPVAEISARDAQRQMLDAAAYPGIPHV